MWIYTTIHNKQILMFDGLPILSIAFNALIGLPIALNGYLFYKIS